MESFVIIDSLAPLIKDLKTVCDQRDWKKLSSLDKRINVEINTALQKVHSDDEKKELTRLLSRIDNIYRLLIKDSEKYRDEISLELRKITRDQKAVNKYLDSSGYID